VIHLDSPIDLMMATLKDSHLATPKPKAIKKDFRLDSLKGIPKQMAKAMEIHWVTPKVIPKHSDLMMGFHSETRTDFLTVIPMRLG